MINKSEGLQKLPMTVIKKFCALQKQTKQSMGKALTDVAVNEKSPSDMVIQPLKFKLSVRGCWIWVSIVIAFGVVTALLPVHLCAQSSASVSGKVTDSTGAIIPGAPVVIQNLETNITQSTVTTSSGNYSIVDVPPGTYSIEITKNGFNTEQETNIILGVGQAATFNFALKTGTVQQSVTVTAEASAANSSSSTLGTVIPTKSVNNLPLNGRNFTELLELTPGVSRISVGQNASGNDSWNPIGSFTYPAVNGQRNRSNMFTLDGANDLGSYNGTYAYMPIIDDILEFKVQSHSDLAEVGQVTGGTINVITKSGTNALHGSLWEFVRNSAFDARDYFLPTVNPLHQNQFGGTVGGPVWIPHIYKGTNKTFFFFAYEGFRQNQAAQTLLTVPTAAQLKGDFSNLLAQGIVLYNPYTTRPDPAHPGEYLRDPFPSNNISSELSPAALLYAKTIFPVPNATGLAAGQNVVDTTPERFDSGSYTGRIDQAFGEHDMLFGRISTYNQIQSTSAGVPNILSSANINGYNITIHETHIFNPTSVLETYFGRNIGSNLIQLEFANVPNNFANTLISNGFSSSFIGGFSGLPQSTYIPSFDIPGYLSFTSTNNYQKPNNSDTYEYGASFSKTLNRQTIKLGGVLATNNLTQPIVTLNEDTSTFQTSNLENPTSPSGASTGDAMASFLIGLPTSAERRGSLEVDHGGWVDGAYAQDQIQVNSKLTINLGVRWDVTMWPIYGYLGNGQGYVGDMDLNNGTYIITAVPPACSSKVGAPCIPGGTLPANVVVTHNSDRNIHNTDYRNWQGRFGFAYHPLDKTSVLGGYGRYYDNWSIATQIAQNVGGTWPSVGLLNADSLNTTVPTATIGDPLNLGSTVIQPAATPFGNATYYYNPNMKTPYSDQWNLGIQQGFGANTTMSITYVGSHSSNLDLGGLHNTAQYPAPGTAAQVASRRQYPYIVPTHYDDSTGNSNYNSLQTTVNKVTSNGLTYLLSYTWSKSIDLACSGSFGVEGCLLQDPYHPQADRSVSGFDLTNQFSGSVVYEIPFGANRGHKASNAFVNNVLGGWNINTITSLTSGTPYSVTVNGDIANVGNTFVQADLVGTATPQHRSPSEWINPAAFQSPPAYKFGTFGRNALRSDWYRDVDLSVFKTFPLFRKSILEFRAEAFNITNTPVFAAPNSVVGSPTFGVVSAISNEPRQLQLALKIQF